MTGVIVRRSGACSWHGGLPRQPERPALISAKGERSFAELNAGANRLARRPAAAGLGEGDAVAVLLTNRPEFAEVVHACQRAGFRLTPVKLAPDRGRGRVHRRQLRGTSAGDRARPRRVARGALEGEARPAARLVLDGALDGFESYDAALEAEDGADLDDPVLGTTMLYTSGTTGPPQGRPPGPFGLGDRGPGEPLRLQRGKRGRPSLHRAAVPRRPACVLARRAPRLRRRGGAHGPVGPRRGAPAHPHLSRHALAHGADDVHRLLALPGEVRESYDVSSLRFVIHGAAPCPVTVKQRLIEWLGPVVVEYYAATEGLGTFVDSHAWLARPARWASPWSTRR